MLQYHKYRSDRGFRLSILYRLPSSAGLTFLSSHHILLSLLSHKISDTNFPNLAKPFIMWVLAWPSIVVRLLVYCKYPGTMSLCSVQVSLEVVFQLFVSQVFISFKDRPIETSQTQFEKINKEMNNSPHQPNSILLSQKIRGNLKVWKLRRRRQSEWKMYKILKSKTQVIHVSTTFFLYGRPASEAEPPCRFLSLDNFVNFRIINC